jgi:hypothetical protein
MKNSAHNVSKLIRLDNLLDIEQYLLVQKSKKQWVNLKSNIKKITGIGIINKPLKLLFKCSKQWPQVILRQKRLKLDMQMFRILDLENLMFLKLKVYLMNWLISNEILIIIINYLYSINQILNSIFIYIYLYIFFYFK